MATVSVRGAWVVLALFCVASLSLISGCGGGGPKKVPVSGSVTLDGAPLNGGVLYFFPDEAKGNKNRIGVLSPARSGKYTMITTAIKDSESGHGAPLGWYKAYLDTTVPGFDGKIHERFTDANKTTVFVEVVENPAPGHYDIKFTSK